MDKLLAFLNGLDRAKRQAFCTACGTTEGYLRKAISVRQPIGLALCIDIDRESGGAVTCEDVRPDIDWGYLRGSAKVGNDGAGVAVA